MQPRLLEIEQLLAQAAGSPVRLELIEPDPDDQGPPPDAGDAEPAENTGPTIAELREQAAQHPLVRAALEAFDAELLNVYPKPGAPDPDRAPDQPKEDNR